MNTKDSSIDAEQLAAELDAAYEEIAKLEQLHDVVDLLKERLDRRKQDIRSLRETLRLKSHQLGHAREQLALAQRNSLEASQAKTLFLARMSHELLTPLNAVTGLTTLCMKTELSGRQREYLSEVLDSAKSLQAIIGEIMDYSNIAGQTLDLEPTPFHLQDVLDELFQEYADRASGRSLNLVMSLNGETSTRLLGVPPRVSQILGHLVDNAIKFTSSGDIIVHAEEIDVAGSDKDTVMIRFSVADSGVGMDASQINHLFELFTQADESYARSSGGTGIGLAICKRLCDLMDGSIEVESEPGKGSTFHVTLPFRRESLSIEDAFPDREASDGVLLLIDHNQEHGRRTAGHLYSLGFEVTTAPSIEQGVAPFKGESPPFDLIMLSCKDLKECRAMTTGISDMGPDRLPPVAVLLDSYSTDMLSAAREAGVSCFLLKPPSKSRILSCISLSDPHQAEPIREKGKDSIRILLAEDIPLNQKVAREHLEAWGLSVLVAANGVEALELAQSEQFDAVLMDVQMPVMDGLEATRRIRDLDGMDDLPIIALTAHALKEDRDKCLAAGMDDFLAKPIDPEALLSTLSAWIPDIVPLVQTMAAPRPAVPKLSADTPGIDPELALRQLSGNYALFLDVLEQFIMDHNQAGRDIRDALENGDRDEARRMAHSMKGMAGNIAALDLAQASKKLEKAIMDPSVPELEEFLRSFDDTLAQALASAEKLCLESRHDEMPVLPSLRILLVDDMRINRKVFSNLLSRRGHQVDVERNGKDACLRLLMDSDARAPFDMILMDIEMPEMDGIAATKKIRAMERGGQHIPLRQGAPIIALTAHDDPHKKQECIDAGMDDCVIKAFDGGELFKAMERLYLKRLARNDPRPGLARRANDNPPLPDTPPPVPMEECFHRLTQSLAGGRLDSEEHLAALRLHFPDTLPPGLETVGRRMAAFDYNGALEALEEVRTALDTR